MGKIRRNAVKDLSKTASENKKLLREIEDSVKILESQQEEVDLDGELHCSVDGRKCDGICRRTNTVQGVLNCFAAFEKRRRRNGPTY